MRVMGYHWLMDLWGLPPEAIGDEARLQQLMVEAARSSGAVVVDARFFRFEPQGASGAVIIAESHLTIHTWPEFGYAAADVFTCGDPALGERIYARLVETLRPGQHRVQRFERGFEAAAPGVGAAS
jgi:S-adenosylmethionine decarboxylase proenzyme